MSKVIGQDYNLSVNNGEKIREKRCNLILGIFLTLLPIFCATGIILVGIAQG